MEEVMVVVVVLGVVGVVVADLIEEVKGLLPLSTNWSALRRRELVSADKCSCTRRLRCDITPERGGF